MLLGFLCSGGTVCCGVKDDKEQRYVLELRYNPFLPQ
jgi:hypothetical protein